MTDIDPALAHHANIAAELAETEAANLRNELRESYEGLIAIKAASHVRDLAHFNFYSVGLFELGGMSKAELAEDRQHIVENHQYLVRDVRQFRRRYGAAPLCLAKWPDWEVLP